MRVDRRVYARPQQALPPTTASKLPVGVASRLTVGTPLVQFAIQALIGVAATHAVARNPVFKDALVRTLSWTRHAWLKLRYRERHRSVGAAFAFLAAVSCAQLIFAGLQTWQRLEITFAAVICLVGLCAAVLWIRGSQLSIMAQHVLYACGGTAVVAAVINDVVVNRKALKFGELPAWFAAIGTVGTLAVSLSLLIRQADERRSEQARLVSAWTEELLLERKPFPVLIVLVKNGSEQVIYNVHISVLAGVRGTFTRYLGSMGPGELREVPIPLTAPPRGETEPNISFVDGAGIQWLRRAHTGRLYNPTLGELIHHQTQNPGSYEDIARHPTLNLHLEDKQYQARRR